MINGGAVSPNDPAGALPPVTPRNQIFEEFGDYLRGERGLAPKSIIRQRARKQSIQPADRAALKRLLSVLRDAGMIPPAALPPVTPQDRIFEEFGDYLRRERGLAPKYIIDVILQFLHEGCPAGAGDLGKIGQETSTGNWFSVMTG